MNRFQILWTPCAILKRCSGHTTSQAKKTRPIEPKNSTHIICWTPMGHKQQLSKGHRRGRSERRKGSQPRNQTPDSQKGAACFSTFKQVFRFIFHWRRIYFGNFCLVFSFFGLGVCAVSRLSVPWFFGFWASWPRDFL